MKLGDQVKVKVRQTNDPEDQYYLEKYSGKTGTLYDISKTKTGKAICHVMFGSKDREGLFYENEIEVVTLD